jgi:anti-anti-sigma factor
MGTTYAEEVLEDDLRKVTIKGHLDAPNTMAIEEGLRALLGRRGDQVIVDLSGVEYMSSYGLRMLMLCAKALAQAGGSLHLAAAQARVMDLITLAGYDTLFPVHETVEDALLSLTG